MRNICQYLSGGQEPDERRGVDGEGELRGQHKVPQD